MTPGTTLGDKGECGEPAAGGGEEAGKRDEIGELRERQKKLGNLAKVA